ncbi:hypothetical protein GCM10020256_66170 [Streptomyces thermocoprophilus]
MVVELQLLLRGEMPADTEIGGVLDQGAVERHLQGALHQLTGLQRDERVAGEQARSYGGPLGHTRRIVEIHLVDGADLDAVAVERLAADQVARIDVGLHGAALHCVAVHPSALQKSRIRTAATRGPGVDLAGRLASGC